MISDTISQWSVGELLERASGLSTETQTYLGMLDSSSDVCQYWDRLSPAQQDEITSAARTYLEYQDCL